MRVVIVTGAGQGIGRAIVERFLADGCACVIAESDDEAGRETAAALAGRGDVVYLPCDVADEVQVQAAIAEVVKRHGGIDVLVNNAGIGGPRPLADLERGDWDRIIAVNLTGAYLCARHAAPQLRRRRGCIVNIASTRALMSEPDGEAYAASKGGLVALTHALALSLGPEVRVNCVSPGWIDVLAWKKSSRRRNSELGEADHLQHPVGRVGRPEDVAEAVAWLSGAGAGFVTGVNLVVDGGMTRKMIYE